MKTRELTNEPIFHPTGLVRRLLTFRGQPSGGFYRSRSGRGKGGVAYEYRFAKRDHDAYPRNPTLPMGREVFGKEAGIGCERPSSALIGPGHGTPGRNHRRDSNDNRLRCVCDDDVDALAKVRLHATVWIKNLERPRCGQWEHRSRSSTLKQRTTLGLSKQKQVPQHQC